MKTLLPEKDSLTLPVAPAWSGHPVGFALRTTRDRQFVAFYDENRHLTAASRRLDEARWTFQRLPEQVGWDSHNGISLALDETGGLHLSGNMHADPLVYFRSREPGDVETLERARMTGDREDCVTYPRFFSGPGGALCFGYRDGSSGQGDQVYNRFEARTKRWERLSVGATVSGEGRRNAYLDGPHAGPDGWFHLCWVWRDTPDCATNHDICYARSRDLVHWETSAGTPLPHPITFATSEVVDPVPVGVGLMNGNVRLGFDPAGRPVISYHKLDKNGATQVFHARRMTNGWEITRATSWSGAWLPTGHGTIRPEIVLCPVETGAEGRLTQNFWTDQLGHAQWELDPVTLIALGQRAAPNDIPDPLAQPSRPGLHVNWEREPSGFALRWETLPENRDQPAGVLVPAPTLLQVVRLHPDAPSFSPSH